MKKIIKILKHSNYFLLLFIVVLPVILTACKDDKDEPTSLIVGTWTCSKHYYLGKDTFIFEKDGSFRWTYDGDWYFQDMYGIYNFDGNILTIINNEGTTWIYFVVSLTESSLVLLSPGFDDPEGESYTYVYYRN